MKQIDFLPPKYRENAARRKAGYWRLGVVLLFGGIITATSAAQFSRRAWVQSQITDTQPMLAQSQTTETHLAQLRSDLAKQETEATLYASLQAPWPRTQIVKAIIDPLHDDVVVERIRLSRELLNANTKRFVAEFSPSEAKADVSKLAPAGRDLQAIRGQLSQDNVAVQLAGRAQEQSRIHAYLEVLEESALVSVVELLEVDSIESDGARKGLRFTANVRIQAPLGSHESSHTAANLAGTGAGER